MCRIGNGLPILIHSGYIGVLKTKTHCLPEKGLDHACIFAFKNLAAQYLNTLQGGVGIFTNISLQQLKCGEQEIFDIFKSLQADKLHQRTINLPQRFLMDQVKPFGIHDAKEKKQLLVFGKTAKGQTLFLRCSKLLGIRFSKIHRNLFIETDDINVSRQIKYTTKG